MKFQGERKIGYRSQMGARLTVGSKLTSTSTSTLIPLDDSFLPAGSSFCHVELQAAKAIVRDAKELGKAVVQMVGIGLGVTSEKNAGLDPGIVSLFTYRFDLSTPLREQLTATQRSLHVNTRMLSS
jgi:hypothetical protein